MRIEAPRSERATPAEGLRSAVAIPTAPMRRLIYAEILIVLSLSLLESAVFALINMLEAPVNPTVAVSVSPRFGGFESAKQFAAVAFALAPVALVLYLVRRNGEPLSSIGVDGSRPEFDGRIGLVLAAVVGAAGVGLYYLAINLGVNRVVIPAPPLGHWWTMPVLLLQGLQNALLEEIVVVAYLITRLERLRWNVVAVVAASAVLRGSYHLYQGWGGFAGNVAMGILFASAFLRWRRTWPLVIAHAFLDIFAGALYVAFDGHIPGIPS